MSDLTTARALTLHPHWAHAVSHLGKDVENRRWSPTAGVSTLLIHAGARSAWDGKTAATIRPFGGPPLTLGEVTCSAIVAVARIGEVCTGTTWSADQCRSCGPWAIHGFRHWRLADVRVLSDPVPCKGRQGLWIPAAEVLDAVAGQLAAMAS